MALITTTIPRERIVLAQTPQVFSYPLLRDAFSQGAAGWGAGVGRSGAGGTIRARCVRGAGLGAELQDYATGGHGFGAILFGAGT